MKITPTPPALSLPAVAILFAIMFAVAVLFGGLFQRAAAEEAPSPPLADAWASPPIPAPAPSPPALLRRGRHASGIWVAWFDLNGDRSPDVALFGGSRDAVSSLRHGRAVAYLSAAGASLDPWRDGLNGNERAWHDVLPTVTQMLNALARARPAPREV